MKKIETYTALIEKRLEPRLMQNDITKRPVVYSIPGMESVWCVADSEYRETSDGSLIFDIYYPADFEKGRFVPAVLFVLGYSDVGFQKMLGCKQKEMASYTTWAKLVAASGMAAITYTTNEPATDIRELIHFVQTNSESLGIDENKIGVWACSGNGPNALSLLSNETRFNLKCAVLCYPYTLDESVFSDVAKASTKFGFVNSTATRSIKDLKRNTPFLIVRGGQDETPYLNETLDRFVVSCMADNLPLTVINLQSAEHAFDVLDDTETSRYGVRQILEFMKTILCGL